MNMEKTGAYLASLRKGRDMTQQQVADILGVSNKTVSKWESGAGLPDIGALPALAALYGVTADDILAGETRPRACGDTPSEVGQYLERRSGLRFRIGYSVAVMLLAAWAAFQYTTWSWLLLLASPICLWLGWSTCRSKDTLRRRILLCAPLCALWLFAAIQLLGGVAPTGVRLCAARRCGAAVFLGSADCAAGGGMAAAAAAAGGGAGSRRRGAERAAGAG